MNNEIAAFIFVVFAGMALLALAVGFAQWLVG